MKQSRYERVSDETQRIVRPVTLQVVQFFDMSVAAHEDVEGLSDMQLSKEILTIKSLFSPELFKDGRLFIRLLYADGMSREL